MKTALVLASLLTVASLAGCGDKTTQPDGPTGNNHLSTTDNGTESPETHLQNNTGNADQDPATANEHSVPRSYCLPDGSGMRVYVWSRKEWSPTVVHTADLPASNPAHC